jgi:hypothetical protein
MTAASEVSATYEVLETTMTQLCPTVPSGCV